MANRGGAVNELVDRYVNLLEDVGVYPDGPADMSFEEGHFYLEFNPAASNPTETLSK